MKLDNVGLPMAEILFKSGYASLLDIVETSPEELAVVMDVSEEEAKATIEQAEARLIQEEQAAEAQAEEAQAEEAQADEEQAAEGQTLAQKMKNEGQEAVNDPAEQNDVDVMNDEDAKP
jgi:transcription termination/antitermination protein NusA